jgi:hypothetical protein
MEHMPALQVVVGLGVGIAGLGIVPSRYPITPRDFAAEIIDSFHLAQFEPPNFSSVANTKFAGWDIIGYPVVRFQVSVWSKCINKVYQSSLKV